MIQGTDTGLEARYHAFYGFDGQKQVFAKAGEHIRDNLECGEVVVDKIILVLPVGTAQG